MNARPALVSWSGGKDSALAMWRARRQGWEPVALFNMLAAREERSRSHGLAPAVLAAQAQALGLPLVTARADWSDYEVVFIATLRDEARRAEAVVFGDIDLDAHREWEEKVCHAAGLEAVLPLWQQPRRALVDEMIATGFVARICAVRDGVLPAAFLGRVLDDGCVRELEALGVDPCGEAGEFHTLVVDGPEFAAPLELRTGHTHSHGGCTFIDFSLA